MATVIIKSGTTAISGATVKGDFSYFSGNTTTDLGPTTRTGLYAGIAAPNNGYTVYQVAGPNGVTARVASNTSELNSLLISEGGTGSTVDQNITWATNTNSVWINSGATVPASLYYVGGAFTAYLGSTQNHFIKLNTNLSKDTTFDIGTGFDTEISAIAVDTNGKVYVGGGFTTFTGTSQNGLIRLNTDGSKDTSFNIGSGFDLYLNSCAVDSNQKVYAAGAFTSYSGISQSYLARLNSNGVLDTTFNIGAGFNSYLNKVVVDSNLKVLAGGAFTTFTGVTQNRLIRLNTDGSKDTSFDIGTGFGGEVFEILVNSNGKIYVSGTFTTYKGVTQNRIIRLNTDGTKDTAFNVGTGCNNGVLAMAIDTVNDKIYLGGAFTQFSGTASSRIVRLNSNGTKDTSFVIGAGFNTTVFSISINAEGRVMVGGNFTAYKGVTCNSNILLNYDGSVYNDTMLFNSTVSVNLAI